MSLAVIRTILHFLKTQIRISRQEAKKKQAVVHISNFTHTMTLFLASLLYI